MAKILIVDDKQENRYVLKNFLKLFGLNSGIEVFEAESGSEAVDVVLAEKPDLVFMDVKMETDDAGLIATKRIRANEDVRDTRIWALTSQAMEAYDNEQSDRKKCLDAGCNEYITKPFDQVELLKHVADVLAIDIPKKTKMRMGIV